MNNPGQVYFDTNYPNYDAQNSSHKLLFYLDLMRRWVPENKTVFELGTGLGNFLQVASSHYSCLGCDPNEFAVEKTSQKVPRASLFTGSYESIPETSAIDAIVSWDVLEHIPDLDRALDTIFQRLPANGFLLGVVPVYDGPLGILVRILDHDPTHVWKCSRGWWINKLKEKGFEPVEYGGILRKLILNKHYLHWTRPQWLWRPAGCAFYFAARKSANIN